MKKYNNISEIPARNYEGYIWDADNKGKPKIYFGDKLVDVAKFNPSSYIIEALLHCKESKKSIHIRHAGEELIHEFDLSHPSVDAEIKEYLPHRLDGVEKVCFKQLWEEEKDSYCEGMPVLKMKALIFAGFEKPPKSKDNA
jgi:CRISPR type III-associated protein (TIGR04423 family)